MGHGRMSRFQLVNGCKRHVLRDLDSGLMPGKMGARRSGTRAKSGEDRAASSLSGPTVQVGRSWQK
jgi:hypothetical protein